MIIPDQKSIELTCEDAEDCDLWCQCFKNAGVYPEDPVRPLELAVHVHDM